MNVSMPRAIAWQNQQMILQVFRLFVLEDSVIIQMSIYVGLTLKTFSLKTFLWVFVCPEESELKNQVKNLDMLLMSCGSGGAARARVTFEVW